MYGNGTASGKLAGKNSSSVNTPGTAGSADSGISTQRQPSSSSLTMSKPKNK
jgi:hypothetical protein